jgi:hypothetical protein
MPWDGSWNANRTAFIGTYTAGAPCTRVLGPRDQALSYRTHPVIHRCRTMTLSSKELPLMIATRIKTGGWGCGMRAFGEESTRIRTRIVL